MEPITVIDRGRFYHFSVANLSVYGKNKAVKNFDACYFVRSDHLEPYVYIRVETQEDKYHGGTVRVGIWVAG